MHSTTVFSTSALRYAAELGEFVSPVYSALTTGGGRDIDIYIVHQLEMIVKFMGTGSEKVMAAGSPHNVAISICYEGGRTAALSYNNNYGFSVAVQREMDSVESEYKQINSDFFKALIDDILNAFESGKSRVETEETLEVIALRDACLQALKNPFSFVKVVK